MAMIGKSEHAVDDILDPINCIQTDIQNGIQSDSNLDKFSSFVPDGYISSSIMDNFHYYAPSKEKHERFYNNHSSHTDSGLMTAVIVTDEPGLEIFDQRDNRWISIEQEVMRYVKESGQSERDPLCHRKYATFFWSDSVEYLNNAPFEKKGMEIKDTTLTPLFHRVADCKGERYSVVFKQRTAPLRTHCRYQEDYVLASIQQKVDTESKNAYTLWEQEDKGRGFWKYGVIAMMSVAAVCVAAAPVLRSKNVK